MADEAGTAGEPDGPEVLHCYRHRTRETGLRCTRCGTPACWECLRPAPVGSHCLKCIREGARTQRHVTLPWERRSGAAVVALVLACVAVYLLQTSGTTALGRPGGGVGPGRGARGVGLDTFTLRYAAVGSKIAAGEWYRLVTAVFLHGGVMHLALNMFALWIFGQEIERREGAVRFLAIFLGAGIVGNVVAYFILPGTTVSVGASGGVFGLLGVALVWAWRSHGDVRPIAALIGLNLLLPLAVPGINVAAHLGGLVAGAAYGLVVSPVARGWRSWAGVALLLALVAAGVLAVGASDPGSLRAGSAAATRAGDQATRARSASGANRGSLTMSAASLSLVRLTT
ncbi:MAG TPA: rhomboid family intramembrane serine protease [Acidimicrobiales bacterium]|nr:rhomboid family intramembrane serine protease [Acidimicrobiales bacterium]